MVHRVPVPLVTSTSHIRVPVPVLAALLPIQFPANATGKAVDAGSSAWVPADPHWGNPEEFLTLASAWPSPGYWWASEEYTRRWKILLSVCLLSAFQINLLKKKIPVVIFLAVLFCLLSSTICNEGFY